MRSLTVAFLLATIAPVAISQPTIVRPGSRVRIDAPGVTVVPVESVILSMTRDTIVVGDEKLSPLSVPRAAIRELALDGGKDRWAGAKKGTVIGLEWGVGIGILMAVAIDSVCQGGWAAPRTCHGSSSGDRSLGFLLGVGSGAFYGAVIGAYVGVRRWDKVDLPAHSTIGLHDGRPALSWSLSF